VSQEPESSSSGLAQELSGAVRFIQSRSPRRPAVGVVLGSGLGAFARSVESSVILSYRDIPHFPRPTVAGHRGELVLGVSGGVDVAVMSGRAHHYEGYSLPRVGFPIRVLCGLGARTLIVTNAAGAVNASYRPGDLMVIEDHINMMGGNAASGPNEDTLGPRFFDMGDAYDPGLRQIAERACRGVGATVRVGVYVAFPGPSYETPAEIRMARALGGDAVGMSTVPEVTVARHMGMRVLGLSCITNMAAGIERQRLDHREVLENAERSRAAVLDVLGRIVREAGGAS
jgi:purine-nucleoside phosphorylase